MAILLITTIPITIIPITNVEVSSPQVDIAATGLPPSFYASSSLLINDC
jgi:hypothetical protein